MTHSAKLMSFVIPVAVLSSLFLSAEAAAQKPPLTLEENVALKRVTQVAMSPTGEAIAYLLSVPRTLYEDDDGSAWSELHVVDFDGNSRPYFSGKVTISDLAWSVDGESIYFVGKRDPAATHPDIFEIPLRGGEATSIYSGTSDIKAIVPSPDGATLAFLATEAAPEAREELKLKGFKALVYEESLQYTHVWLLDLSSGEVTMQDLGGSVSDFDWAPDGKHYAVAMAPTPEIDDEYMARDVFIVSRKDGAIRNQLGSIGKLGHFAWSPDGASMAYVGSEDIHDPSAGRLYVVSASGGERRDIVPEYPGHIEDFEWLDDESIAYVAARGLWSEFARASVRRIRPAGDAPDSGPIVHAIHAHPGQREVAAVADSATHPPEVYLLQPGAEPRRLTYSNPILQERSLGRQEEIRYPARDGVELEAVVIHPQGSPPDSGWPLIIVVHGGPEAHYSSGWVSDYARPGQVMAGQGYLVAFPNYRGSTGRGVAFSKMGQHDHAAAEFDDIVDLKTSLVEAGLADKDRTGITGGSYGGYASMWAASALSEHFAAAVASVGISNQSSLLVTTDIPREMVSVHARAWPWEDWMWMLQRSPVYHADKTRTPLLIMTGDQDPRVHPSQSLEMYRHVRLRTDTPVRLVYYPGEKHGNRNTAAQYDYSLRFERWMNHYLKGPGGAPPPYEIDHAARLAAEQ